MTPAPGSHDGDVGLPDYVDGWMAHGHRGYRGYAWYRRPVPVPAGPTSWDILGPTLVDHGYELYWNGRLLGGSGRIGPYPRLVGTRPLRFALPADAVEPMAMVALIGLMAWLWPSSGRKGFLVFVGVALALTAVRRASNAIASWTDLEDLKAYAWVATWLSAPTVAAWTLAWNRWRLPPWRLVDVAALGLAVAGTLGAAIHASNVTSASRFASIALLVVMGARIARGGPDRILALVTLVSILAVVFGGELLDPLHVPGIWFPFGIGVSRTQYVYAIALPLLAILIARTLGPERKP